MKSLMDKFDKKFKAYFIIQDKKLVAYKEMRRWINKNFVPKKQYIDLFNETAQHRR